MPDHRDLDLDEFLDLRPPRSLWKIIGLGIVAAAAIAAWGVHTWITGEATWYTGRRGSDLLVRNDSAQAVAWLKFASAALVHIRWFWGSLDYPTVFHVGTRIALLGIAASIVYGIYTIFF